MSVADILQRLAENAGRSTLARGALIGNTISSAAAIPGQILDDQEKERLRQQQQARLNAQDARGAAQDARQAASDARDQAAQQAAAQHKIVVDAGLAAAMGASGDPNQFDARAAFAEVSKRGDPSAIRDVIAAHRAIAPAITQQDPAKDTYVDGVLTKAGVTKAPEMGTPAYEIWARQQALLTPPASAAAAPSAGLPGAIATLPPLTSAGTTAPPVASPAPPAAPTGLTPNAAALQAYADQRTATAAAAAAAPAAIETARHNKEMERIGNLTAGREIAAQRETARHNAATEKAADPFGGAAPGGPSGADLLDQMPAAQRAQSQALVDGRRTLDARMASTPFGRTIIAGAYAIDPTFDQANYNARAKARTDLTSPNGTGGKTIGALNTAIQHAGKLSDLIETLDNFETPLANAIVNPIKTAFGSTKVTNFDTVAPQLAKEIERVWRGAGGTAGEIHDLIETIGHNKGKQQQREALQQFVDLAKGKLDALETQRDNVMGKTAGATIPILFDQNKPIIDTIAQRASGTPATASGPAEGATKPIDGFPGTEQTFTNGKWIRTK